ncbi:MAG: division/cell wall cluster transcriptional repressor MraZ [Bacillota bacterium]|nr:division/cell wall cluster transcriptional repressor MraZ [Bacillota bacterium]
MFYGEYQHTVDPKGRLIIPSKLREGLGEKFIVTKGFDNCLFAYSMEEWKNFEDKMKTLPLTDKDARAFVRFFFAGATECEVDKQGRILIAQNLREYAGIEKDAYVIGMAARVEIWDKTRWEEYQSGENLNADKLAEKLSMLGMQL